MSPVLSAEEFLSVAELQQVKAAIARAERRTSGEIRVHLDGAIVDDVLDHAAFVFGELGMHRTKDRNGVLIYVSVPEQRLAVIGDAGIHERLPDGYWNEVLGVVIGHFKDGRFCDGLCAGVERLGEQLRAHFPFERGDVNELDDEVSFGKR